MRAVSPTFHWISLQEAKQKMLHQHHQKVKLKTTACFLYHKINVTAQHKSNSGCFTILASKFIYISQWTLAHRSKEKHMHYYGGWDSVSAVISRTWLYNWSLIDMKSSGLSQVMFYTCCCPRAEIAGGLPQSWCHLLIDVSVENALQQSVATISLCLSDPLSICAKHLLPFICHFIFCA